jgi:ribosomal protein L11 methyltransferase
VPPIRPIVQLEVPEEDAELAADALWQGHPSAVSEVGLGGGRVRLLADPTDLDGIDPRWPVEVVEPDGEAHLDAWRDWARPVRAGRRILLQPDWLPADDDARTDDLVLRLDPGRAFGSGSHPSTRLVLTALEELITGGERVLDVGCGSGVLAVAACRLGARSAVAIDVDPAAVEATAANAARNGVGERVEASTAGLAEVAGTFDVVVANIGVRVLVDIAPALVRVLRPGGALVVAGLLEAQADEVVAACVGAVEVRRDVDDGWVAGVLRREG